MAKTLATSVIIVGGGLGGLTLALCLESAEIPYIVLERRSGLVSPVGAGYGILDLSWPFLDQLGCANAFDEKSTTVSLLRMYVHNKKAWDGSVDMTLTRTGYSEKTLDRLDFVNILFSNIKKKRNVQFGKNVQNIEQTESGVRVICSDSTSYDGQILVGADGIRSSVRKVLHPLQSSEGFSLKHYGLGGASKINLDFPPMVTYDFNQETGILTFPGPGKIFWAIGNRFKVLKSIEEPPRYTAEDAEQLAKELADLPIFGGLVRFSDLWSTKEPDSGFMVALEEGFLEQDWTRGRLVLIGDAVQKVNPITGLGGNVAMTGAVSVANAIKRIADQAESLSSWSSSIVKEELSAYEREQRPLLRIVCKNAWEMTENLTGCNWLLALIIRLIFTLQGDTIFEDDFNRSASWPLLHFLPPPEKRLRGTMPLNLEFVLSNTKEAIGKRAKRAIPFLVLLCAAGLSIYFNGKSSLGSVFETQKIPQTQLPVVVDYGLMYTLMLIESTRFNMMGQIITFPFIFGILAQATDPTIVIPLYCFLYYISMPISKFKALDHRLTDVSYSKTVLFAMTLTYFIPLVISYSGATFATLKRYNQLHEISQQLWLYFPLTTSIIQSAIRQLGLVSDTIKQDRFLSQPHRRDFPWLISQVAVLTFFSSWTWNISHPYSLRLISPSLLINMFSKDSLVLFYISPILWLIYLAYDMRHHTRIPSAINVIGLSALPLILLGPGATIGLGWLFREYFLIHSQHRAALTKENWEELYENYFGFKISYDVDGQPSKLLTYQKKAPGTF